MPLQTFPIYPAKAVVTKQLPFWPAASIILLLIFALIFSPGLLTGMNLYLLLLAMIVWISSNEKFDPYLLKIIMPFGLIIVFGLVVGLGADQYLYLKDVWYVSNPAVIMCVGYVLYRCQPDVARGLRAFVIGGTLIALFYLSSFVAHPDLIFQSAVKIRESIGTGYYAPALGFIILFSYYKKWPEGLGIPNWLAFFCFIISTLAIVLSFSRTIILVAIIGILASYGFFYRREWQRIASIAVAGLVIISVLNLSVDVDSRQVQHTFVGKLARSLDEINIKEYYDFKSINENWRGYETSQALKAYFSGAPVQWLFGQGFGAQVDLGLAMPLGGGVGEVRQLKRFIPVLHNGYAYLLVKGGAVAIVLFCYVLFWLYWIGRQAVITEAGRFTSAPARVLQAIAVALAVTTWVVAGVFNKLDLFPFLLAAGFLLASITSPKVRQS